MLLLAVVGAKADVIPSSYYSAVGEGTFYIYDVANQTFMGRNGNRIEFEANPTKTFTLTAVENGEYTIRYDATTTYMMWNPAGTNESWASDVWMDANGVRDDASGNKYATWNFTLTTDNKYKISSSNSYDAATEKTGGTARYLQGGKWSTTESESAHEYALIKAYTSLIPSNYFSEPAEGTFYLYNVKQGQFLQRLGNNFPGFTTTPASVTVASAGETGVYYIKFEDSNWLHTGYWNKQYLWTDKTGVEPYKWTFNPLGGRTRTYQLVTSSSHTVEGTTGYWYANGTNARTSPTDDCQWALISAANYTAWQNSFSLSDADLYGISSLTDIYNVNPTVNRTMTANAWNTLVVPFDMAIPSGWTVKEPTAFDGSTLTFGDASTIVHGKPYIVKPDAAVTSFSATGVTLYKDLQNTSVSEGALTMTGTYTAGTVPTDSYVIGIKDGASALYKVNSSVSINPFRAYFTVAGSSTARITISFDESETTSINTIANSQKLNANAQYYNLNGQRVENPTKGLYIKNGKKVIIK